MADVNVVITFYSHGGATEKLALAAALGAVQARANIRLRRLPDTTPGKNAECERMDQEYVAPREADALWADAFIVATSARLNASAPEWKVYLDALALLAAQGKLAGKVGTAVAYDAAVQSSICSAMAQLGLIPLPAGSAAGTGLDEARLCGRRVGKAARGMKHGDAAATPGSTSE